MKTKFTIFLKVVSFIVLAAIAFSSTVLARSLSPDRTNTDIQDPIPSSLTSSEESENSTRTENVEIELESSHLNPTSEIDQERHFSNLFNTDGQSKGENRRGLSSGRR